MVRSRSVRMGAVAAIVLAGMFAVSVSVWSLVKGGTSSYGSAVGAYRAGDLDQSIGLLDKEMRRDARTNDAHLVTARRILAQSLYMRDQGDDRVRAAQLLREIVEDPSATPAMRVAALNDMTGFYIRAENRWSFAKKAIFQGELFGSFLRDDGVPMAMKRMIEYGYDLHPTPDAALYTAYWYAEAIRFNAGVPKDGYASLLSKWINEGEGFLSGEKKYRPEVYAKEELAQLYSLDAEARSVLVSLAPKDSPLMTDGRTLVEQSYQRALAALAPEDDFQSYQQGLVIRFRYASFLASAFGDARTEDIRSIVDPIVRAPRKFASDAIVTPIERMVRNTADPDLDRIVPGIRGAVER